jgi:hypothetical protein
MIPNLTSLAAAGAQSTSKSEPIDGQSSEIIHSLMRSSSPEI